MLLRVAAADDLPLDLMILREDLSLLAPKDCQVAFSGYSTADALLADFAPDRFDLILMDIIMKKGTSGIDAARTIRLQDPHCLLVFITSSPDYAWQSFPLHPFDYLVKPYERDHMEQLLADAVRTLETPPPEIELRVARKDIRLPLANIQYVQASDHAVLIMPPRGELRCLNTYHDIQARLLQDGRFLECNRGLMVNMDDVDQLSKGAVTMLDGKRFSLRQRGQAQLVTAFAQYQFRHMKKE